MSTITLTVEFSGGLELLFANQRAHTLSIPAFVPHTSTSTNTSANIKTSTRTSVSAHDAHARAADADADVDAGEDTGEDTGAGAGQRPADVAFLILYLRDHLLRERPELFVEGGTVRPGILVLVNDTDWELEGEGACALRDGDEVVFISTLHGG